MFFGEKILGKNVFGEKIWGKTNLGENILGKKFAGESFIVIGSAVFEKLAINVSVIIIITTSNNRHN
jgi:hypothetical protein